LIGSIAGPAATAPDHKGRPGQINFGINVDRLDLTGFADAVGRRGGLIAAPVAPADEGAAFLAVVRSFGVYVPAFRAVRCGHISDYTLRD
jgi:hypothetical protein